MILLTTSHLPPQLNQPTSHLPPALGLNNINSEAKVKLQTINFAHVPFYVWPFFQDALNSMLGCYRTVGNLNGGMLLNDTAQRRKSGRMLKDSNQADDVGR